MMDSSTALLSVVEPEPEPDGVDYKIQSGNHSERYPPTLTVAAFLQAIESH